MQYKRSKDYGVERAAMHIRNVRVPHLMCLVCQPLNMFPLVGQRKDFGSEAQSRGDFWRQIRIVSPATDGTSAPCMHTYAGQCLLSSEPILVLMFTCRLLRPEDVITKANKLLSARSCSSIAFAQIRTKF